MTEIPDDVVKLAAEAYAKMQGWPTDYAVTDGWRERRHSTMRHAPPLPEVRAALAPSPVPPQDGVTAQSALSHCLNGVRPYDRAATIIKALAGHGYVIVPALVPVVSQAERLARVQVAAMVECDDRWRKWEAQTDRDKASFVAAAQALIDDGTIPPEPEPDVAEMLWIALNDESGSLLDAIQAIIADGWTFTPPPLGTEKGGD